MNNEKINKVFRVKTKSDTFEGILLKADSDELVFRTRKEVRTISREEILKISKLKTDPKKICKDYGERLDN